MDNTQKSLMNDAAETLMNLAMTDVSNSGSHEDTGISQTSAHMAHDTDTYYTPGDYISSRMRQADCMDDMSESRMDQARADTSQKNEADKIIRRKYLNKIQGKTNNSTEDDFIPIGPSWQFDKIASCIVCDYSPRTYFCKGCKQARYCSKLCQTDDWPTHRRLCQQLYEQSQSESPTILVFGPNDSHPTLQQISNYQDFYQIVHKSATEDCDTISGTSENLHAHKSVYVRDIAMGLNGVYNAGHVIEAIIVTSEKTSHVRLNRSIASLAKPGHLAERTGTYIFTSLGHCLSNNNRQFFGSLLKFSARDFRAVVDWFGEHPKNPCVTNRRRWLQGANRFWPAVKLNSEGEIKLYAELDPSLNLDRAENIVIRSGKMDDEELYGCLLPRMAGLPWVARRCVDSIVNKSREFKRNYGARVFATTKGFQAHDLTDRHVVSGLYNGTIVLCHEDGHSIKACHVLCFFDFFEAEVRKLERQRQHGDTTTSNSQVGDTNSRGNTDSNIQARQITMGDLEKLITRERFHEYWEGWSQDEKDHRPKDKVDPDLEEDPYEFENLEAAGTHDPLEAARKELEVVTPDERAKALQEAKKILWLDGRDIPEIKGEIIVI
ncbi:hypothetical protein F5Y15DRAFT_320884 [Xylariaceae sp. FL0016]|nr:hypothetical protein F5Y15DRAFT_320884 [Xylariaceae sp. FL0016]